MSPIRDEVQVGSEQTIDLYYTSDLEDDVKDLFSFVVSIKICKYGEILCWSPLL